MGMLILINQLGVISSSDILNSIPGLISVDSLSQNESITISIAFLAGLASFFSPCILPLLPGYLAYLGSVALE